MPLAKRKNQVAKTEDQVDRQQAKTKNKVDRRPEYIKCMADFIDENGSFTVKIHTSPDLTNKKREGGERIGKQIFPELTVIRPPDSKKSLYVLKDYFKCGVVKANPHGRIYRIRSARDLRHKVVPFFKVHRWNSQTQRNNFERLREVIEIMAEREHLQVEGFERVKGIIADFTNNKSHHPSLLLLR